MADFRQDIDRDTTDLRQRMARMESLRESFIDRVQESYPS